MSCLKDLTFNEYFERVINEEEPNWVVFYVCRGCMKVEELDITLSLGMVLRTLEYCFTDEDEADAKLKELEGK